MAEIENKAEELTQEYFQEFGGFTCSWENVNKIIQDRLKKEFSLIKENEEIKKENAQLKQEAVEVNRVIRYLNNLLEK